ncbi:MAG: DUF2017 domain-containing protein [Actinomycetota bacterium]|nr:DUF2017 domain-containing protein [Actinomycetota bacterium]
MAEISSVRGEAVLQLDAEERGLLHQLLSEMKTLLEAELPPTDEVTRRLFPDAYDDDREAQQFRALTGDELRSDKLAAVAEVEDQIANDGRVELAPERGVVKSLLTVLTDLRLAIGTRLGVTEETMGAQLDPSDPETPALSVLHWLGWIQELVLSAINP